MSSGEHFVPIELWNELGSHWNLLVRLFFCVHLCWHPMRRSVARIFSIYWLIIVVFHDVCAYHINIYVLLYFLLSCLVVKFNFLTKWWYIMIRIKAVNKYWNVTRRKNRECRIICFTYKIKLDCIWNKKKNPFFIYAINVNKTKQNYWIIRENTFLDILKMCIGNIVFQTIWRNQKVNDPNNIERKILKLCTDETAQINSNHCKIQKTDYTIRIVFKGKVLLFLHCLQHVRYYYYYYYYWWWSIFHMQSKTKRTPTWNTHFGK